MNSSDDACYFFIHKMIALSLKEEIHGGAVDGENSSNSRDI